MEVQFDATARAAHDTVYGGIRGRAVRRTVSDDNQSVAGENTVYDVGVSKRR